VVEQRARPSKARFVAVILISAISLIIITGHILALSQPSLAIFSRLFDIFLITLVTLLAISLGERLLQVIRLETASFLERTVFAFGLGLGIISYLLLLLALLHLLYPLAIFVLLAVLCIISFKPMASWLPVLPTRVRELLRELKSPWLLLYTALAVITIALIGIRALLPPSNTDTLVYHLPAAQGFLKAHTIVPFYDNLGANFPALMQLLYAIGIAAHSDALAQLLSAMTMFFAALAVAAFSVRFFSRRLGFIAFSVFWAADVLAQIAITAHIDMAMTFYIFLGIYAVFIHLEGKGKKAPWRSGWLIIAAVAIAFALGTKYPAIFWLGAIPLWLAWERLIKLRQGPRRWLGEVFIFLFLALIIAGYWYLKNWLWLDNPVYPFFFGGKGVEQFLLQELKQGADYLGSGHGFGAFFINLWKIFKEPGRFYIGKHHYINYLFILLPLYLFLKKNHPVNILLFLSGLYYIYWVWSVQGIRYLVPIFPLLSIATAYILDETIKPRKNIRLLKNLVPLAALIIMAANTKLQFDMTKRLCPWKYLAGRKPKEYILKKCDAYSYFLPAVEYMNNELPRSAKILMLFEARSYYIQRSTIPDYHILAWKRLLAQHSSNEEIYETLRSQGVTHILFNRAVLKFHVKRGISEAAEVEGLSQPFLSFAQDYLQLEFEAHMSEIYRLAAPSPP